ncbi:glycosyltransferase family 39 protein [Candidatus Nitrosopelagicus sp.]|nr:glycosyltransferase family 39 protein [Candidatus Nitrosopelagicus sp.]
MKGNNLIISESVNFQRIPIIITLTFFVLALYIALANHNYWTFDIDGQYYLEMGKEILHGEGENVLIPNAGIGGPVIYALLDELVNDGFNLLKIIAVICSSAIIYLTYHIIRNFLDHKTAIVGQLFLVFNPYFLFFSIQAENEILPFFLFIASLYFITKKNLTKKDIIFSGFLIGIAFTIRYQFVVPFLSYIIFIIIYRNNFKKKISQSVLFITIFFLIISPVLIYNEIMFDSVLGGNSSWYIASSSEFASTEFREQSLGTNGIVELILLDPGLFLKNYFWNMFYNIPGNLFNFNFIGNTSISPIIPFVAIFPFLGGLLYNFKTEFSRKKLIFLISVACITTIMILIFGDITIHGVAICLIPIFVFVMMNIRKIEQNFLPILIIPIIFFLTMSVIRLFSGEQFFIISISISIFSAIFFMKMIPEIYLKIRKMNNRFIYTRGLQIFLIVIIAGLFASDLGYSYVLYRTNNSGIPFESINKEILYLIEGNNINVLGEEYKKAGEVLSKESDIEKKYIMTNNWLLTPYVDSKLLFTLFNEGEENESIENFLIRKDWKEHELLNSGTSSIPGDRLNKLQPIPDYLVFRPHEALINNQHDFLRILSDPSNPNVPANFELIFASEKIDLVVYKINYDD